MHSFQASYFGHGIALLHYHEIADSNSTFCFVCMCNASREKIPSGNADSAFESNCDHNYNYMVSVHIQM